MCVENWDWDDTGEKGAAVVTVVGVGGAGCNAINAMLEKDDDDTRFIVMNMDEQGLQCSPCPHKVHLDAGGRGEGGWQMGRQAALQSREDIVAALGDVRMVVLVAGLGGACGTGSLPVIAGTAREMGALVVCIVTLPFRFEGMQRAKTAREGLGELLPVADCVIVMPNDALMKLYDQTLTLRDYFGRSNDVLYRGVRSLCGLEDEAAIIRVGFADIRSLLGDERGGCLGTLHYRWAGGAREAVRALLEEARVNEDLCHAENILASFEISFDTTIEELNEAAEMIRRAAHPDALVLLRVRVNEETESRVGVTVIATGFARRLDEYKWEVAP